MELIWSMGAVTTIVCVAIELGNAVVLVIVAPGIVM